jgi:error-prone DNA polymerase
MALIGERQGHAFSMQDIPDNDSPTYDMVCAADTVGVFQIESRAQMSMLPRLKPRSYYDLVIEVALVRPGPIQGGAVHPYLDRRRGLVPETYPGPDNGKALRGALGRTLGVPIFQEQCMQIAMLAAGFTPGEADDLRRAMAAWKRHGNLHKYERRLVDGMTARGYEPEFAQGVYEQIKGFSSYGFPESHAASFALLVYVSAWIKCHYPAEFLTALLNSQPLGFYTPSQLVQDAKRHGVEVRPVDVVHSDWDCTLEVDGAVRLGLRLVSGLKREAAQRIVMARTSKPFDSTQDLARRAALDQPQMKSLAAADALMGLSGHRRQQVWDAAALQAPPALLKGAPVDEAPMALPPAPEGEAIVWDYAALGLTLRRHPLALLRPELARRKLMSAEELKDAPNGRLVRHCGIVTLRQQPGTASGVVFVSLEDETGVVQVIVWKHLRERQRLVLAQSRLLAVRGVWQRDGEAKNLIAGHLEDLTPLLSGLSTVSRDFH